MKNIILLFTTLLTGCATLGFSEFSEDSTNTKKDRIKELASVEIPVEFTYQPLIGGKHEVFLAGDFNNWSPTETLMNEKDGIYTVTLQLQNGKYSYKFIVDGQWLIDENADESIDDGFGGQNSIIYVGNRKEINALRKVHFSYQPEKVVKEVLNLIVWKKEGKNSNWQILDYIDIVVHIFKEETREYYNLEELWGDGKMKKIN